jgi:hypothetical protein
VTEGFSFDDEPKVNSQDELTKATRSSRNLRLQVVLPSHKSEGRFPGAEGGSVLICEGAPTGRPIKAQANGLG